MLKKILFISIILLTISCHCSKNTVDPDLKPNLNIIKEDISQKYKGKYTIKLNAQKDYALAYQAKKIRKNNPFPTIFFSVYDIKTGKETYKDIIPGGQVKWIDDYTLIINSFVKRPKNIHTESGLVLYKLNVKTLNRFK